MRIFKEHQKFTQTWLIMVMILLSILPTATYLTQYLEGEMPLGEFLLVQSLVILVMGFIFIIKLKTKIDKEGIKYQFFPFHFSYRAIYWKDIEKVYVRKYNAILEYGGWGLKGGFFSNKKNGLAYNVSGNIGIQIHLKNGKRILIGTKQKTNAKQAINYNFKTNESI